jgi:acyl-CoA reductase-like NAD-dependent aldehyde dehydrogenase
MHEGRICMTEWLIVDEKIADRFVSKPAARTSQLAAGDPRGHLVPGSPQGRQICRRRQGQTASDGVKRMLADRIRPGASMTQPVLVLSSSFTRLKASVMLLTGSAQKNGSPGGV